MLDTIILYTSENVIQMKFSQQRFSKILPLNAHSLASH